MPTGPVTNPIWDLWPGYARLNPADPLGAFTTLRDIPMDAVEQAQVDLIAGLAGAWMEDDIPNQGIKSDPSSGLVEIGDSLFSGAAAAWKKLAPIR
jgi:hypothetical protein